MIDVPAEPIANRPEMLNGNPLADIKNTCKIESVVLAGRYFSRADLDRPLISVEATAADSKYAELHRAPLGRRCVRAGTEKMRARKGLPAI